MGDYTYIEMLQVFEEQLTLIEQCGADSKEETLWRVGENAVDKVLKYGYYLNDYSVYLGDYEELKRGRYESVINAGLLELFTLLIIFSREDHMQGNYGSPYKEGIKNGSILFLYEQIVSRLKKLVDKNSSDKSTTIGVAGEYFVAAELTRRGYVASLTSKNTKTVDLIASSKDGARSVCIQIKTCNNKKLNTWIMNQKHEDCAAENLIFIFVNLREGEIPEYFIVSSRYVAEYVKENHLRFTNSPGKGKPKKTETTMRKFNLSENNEYKDAWYLLGLD